MFPRTLQHAARTAARRAPLARHLTPFLAVGAVAVGSTVLALPMAGEPLAIGAALVLLAAAMVLCLPWKRLPAVASALPALVFLAAVGLLRDAAGGAGVGLNPLVLLPVLWLGLYGTRVQLVLAIPAVAAVFFVPILAIGAPRYPASQWHLGVLYVAISLLIGPNVQQLIRRVKSQAQEARRREHEIARVADVARQLSTGEGTRRDVCSAACEIGGSAFALLWEPDAKGRLVSTAAAGVEVPALVLDPTRERSAALTTFRTNSPILVPDASADPGVDGRLVEHVGAAGSILFQPVLRRGQAAGVLVLGWRGSIDHEEDRVRVLVGLLAAEAAIAIQRADLMTRLEEMADTDELTGLPNRRGWNRELEIALSGAGRRRSPLCVAQIDVDRFKHVNDVSGHQAGDRLLKEAAASWRSTLRPADVLARPGGDEFTLVLPDCDVTQAMIVLDRLRKATPRDQTCSIGVAQWDGGEPAERLLARADEALYGAKDAGRDRVVAAAA